MDAVTNVFRLAVDESPSPLFTTKDTMFRGKVFGENINDDFSFLELLRVRDATSGLVMVFAFRRLTLGYVRRCN